MFKLVAECAPLDTDNPLACAATHSRMENALRRSDLYRMDEALILQFILKMKNRGQSRRE